MVGVCSDITERKQAEAERKAVEEERARLLVREQAVRAEIERASRLKDRLKADGATRDIPIIILTARKEPGGAQRAVQAGCAAYLTKPCRPAELVAVIRKVLSEQQSV